MPEPTAAAFESTFEDEMARLKGTWTPFQLTRENVLKMKADDAGDLHSFLKSMVFKVSEHKAWTSRVRATIFRKDELATRQTAGS